MRVVDMVRFLITRGLTPVARQGHSSRTRWRWLIIVALEALLGADLLISLVGCTSFGSVTPPPPPAMYLALGDSITFGYNPLLDPNNASNFVGFPNAVAQTLGLSLTNAACPGATSGYFVSLYGADWDCLPYRSQYPLHVSYTTSQLDFAVAFLRAHPTTRLISIAIGYNDLVRSESLCGDNTLCVAYDLPTLLTTLSNNLDAIYSALRVQARYSGKIVALTYYSLNYQDATQTGFIQAVNQVETQRAQRWGVAIADGFGAFQRASAPYNGDACAAGLLIRTSPSSCDLHPSAQGHALLANTLLAVVRAQANGTIIASSGRLRSGVHAARRRPAHMFE